jgi:hypothetical protein
MGKRTLLFEQGIEQQLALTKHQVVTPHCVLVSNKIPLSQRHRKRVGAKPQVESPLSALVWPHAKRRKLTARLRRPCSLQGAMPQSALVSLMMRLFCTLTRQADNLQVETPPSILLERTKCLPAAQRQLDKLLVGPQLFALA